MRATKFPISLHGQCPICIGGGAGPSSDTTGAFASTVINKREDVPLEYSAVWDKFVCKRHVRTSPDVRDNQRFTERDKIVQQNFHQMGFRSKYTKN